jgi:hypothetical protein
MKKLLSIILISLAVTCIATLQACKKSNPSGSSQLSAGTGSYTFNGTMVNTNDTLGPDIFSGGKDLTMWPTGNSAASNLVFVYNMPSQSSGSVNLSDGSNSSSTTPYILGNINNINFASVANSGTVTKNSATSFSFSCTVSDDSNPSNTYTLSGSGTY